MPCAGRLLVCVLAVRPDFNDVKIAGYEGRQALLTFYLLSPSELHVTVATRQPCTNCYGWFTCIQVTNRRGVCQGIALWCLTLWFGRSGFIKPD